MLTLDEFYKEALAVLNDLRDHWMIKHAEDPQVWPNVMEGGDWWDAFLNWEIPEAHQPHD